MYGYISRLHGRGPLNNFIKDEQSCALPRKFWHGWTLSPINLCHLVHFDNHPYGSWAFQMVLAISKSLKLYIVIWPSVFYFLNWLIKKRVVYFLSAGIFLYYFITVSVNLQDFMYYHLNQWRSLGLILYLLILVMNSPCPNHYLPSLGIWSKLVYVDCIIIKNLNIYMK